MEATSQACQQTACSSSTVGYRFHLDKTFSGIVKNLHGLWVAEDADCCRHPSQFLSAEATTNCPLPRLLFASSFRSIEELLVCSFLRLCLVKLFIAEVSVERLASIVCLLLLKGCLQGCKLLLFGAHQLFVIFLRFCFVRIVLLQIARE